MVYSIPSKLDHCNAPPHPHLVHRPGPARPARAVHAVRAQAGPRPRDRPLLDRPARPVLLRARAAGRRALGEWLATPTAELTVELRAPGLLKLHPGADPGPLADAQLKAHRGKLAEYEEIAAAAPQGADRGPW